MLQAARTRRNLRSFLVGAVVLAGAGGASAQQILEVYGDSLTAYKPTSATAVQDVRPQFLDRGVHLDGGGRAGSVQGWALAGNPFGDGAGWGSNHRLEDLRLDTGAYSPTEIDLSLPSIGVSWVIGRSYNGSQVNGSSAYDSNGYQGRNWMQMSQPELRRVEGSTNADDMMYLVYGADRFIEFRRTSSTSDVYKSKNGAAGVLVRYDGLLQPEPPDDPETYVYFDPQGNKATFFGSDNAGSAAWQLWKIEDAAGNVAYVGDETNPQTALGGYTSGRITTAYDPAGRRYTYAYSTIDGVSRLTQVKAEINWSTSAVEVGKVDYAYYQTGDNTWGDNGTLKSVTTTLPATSGDYVRRHYYRYYKGSYNSSSNPGHPYTLKLVVNAEGWRRYEGSDGNFADDDINASGLSVDALKEYSAAYLEYNDASSGLRRVRSATFNGQCGCAGGATGTYEFSYDAASDYATKIGNTSYDNGWATRTVVMQPENVPGGAADHTYFTQYFDEVGQPLSRVITDGDPAAGTPPSRWVTEVTRGPASPGTGEFTGCIVQVRTPAANTGYTHNSGSPSAPDGSITASSSVGLVHSFVRVANSDSSGLAGFVTSARWHRGSGTSTVIKLTDTAYTSHSLWIGGIGQVRRPAVSSTKQYTDVGSPEGTGQSSNETLFGYEWHSGTTTDPLYLVIKKITTTYPTVSAASNGSDSGTIMTQWFNTDATPSFAKAPDGIVSWRGYNSLTGLTSQSVEDADTSLLAHVPSGAESSGTEIHNVTSYAYDNQGRINTVTLPSGRVTKTEYKALDDRRLVTVSTPKYIAGGPTYHGPASYSITNHAGKAEAQGTIGFSGGTTTTAPAGWVNAGGDDYSCISGGGASVTRLSTTEYTNASNQATEARLYTNFTGMSFPGTAGTHYDATFYAYDGLGRKWRIKDPTGTIDRTVFDALGRPIEQWTGTNDNGWSGGETSGTANMVKTAITAYDGGSAGGNSHVTSRTLDPDGDWGTTTDQRVTSYLHDDRGRAIVINNPQNPEILNKYDNLGRLIATGQYSSDSGLDAADDPTSLATNRVSLSQTDYDAKGQVYRTTRHNINQSTGASADTLVADLWYDSVGRRIKVQGEELSKTAYDRLGRPTHRFILAQARASGGGTESAYTDADDVVDDIVLEEHQTVYENTTGNVLFTATIGRHVNESSTHYGARDRNDDTDPLKLTAGDIVGRIQIAANWYDALDRLTSTVNYGSNLIVGDDAADTSHDFTRPSDAPTGDADKLRTDYSYPDYRQQRLSSGFYGTYQDVTDANGKKMRTWFDDGGRAVIAIANYVNDVPNSDGNNDDDVFTRFAYTNGLRTKVWTDFDGDGTEDTGTNPATYDQVTTYAYGVPKGTGAGDSAIASNRLLLKVTNPPQKVDPVQSVADREVTFAYNALGQQIYREDQEGNIIEQEYDTAGRLTVRKATTIADGFDTAVQAIGIVYESRGLTSTVTQYNGTSLGEATPTDQVKYEYDGWNPPNITKFEQDVDSVIGGGGRAAFSVQYALSKNAPDKGRRTVRRTSMTMPNGSSMACTYGSAGTINGDASRIGSVSVDSVTVSRYYYTGVGQVMETELPEPYLERAHHAGATHGSYPDLDRFNRVTSDRWGKIASPSNLDFHDVDIAYDNVGNVLRTVDNVHRIAAGTGSDRAFDRISTLDGLYRVTAAAEGQINGGITGTSISSGDETRTELWGLSQTGNFNTNKLDLDGDVDYADFGAGEVDDARVYTPRNEIDTWRPGGSGQTPSSYNVQQDKVGNIIDDGRDYQFKYDVFGRLTQIYNENIIASYTYNGVCQWTGGQMMLVEHLAGTDPWYWRCNDEAGRLVATFRDEDEDPKEQFYRHAAGLGGFGGGGGGGYNHAVILRDKDASTDWDAEADDTLDERRYSCHDSRGSLCNILTDLGYQVEAVRYFTYGTPFGIPAGDMDADGDYQSDDESDIDNWTTGYDVRGDIDLDGSVSDYDLLEAPGPGTVLGRGVLSRTDVGNRVGWGGHQTDGNIDRFLHSRVWDTTLAGYLAGTTNVGCSDDYEVGPPRLVIPSPDPCAANARSHDDCMECCRSSAGGEPRADCVNSCHTYFSTDPRTNPDRNPDDWNYPDKTHPEGPCRGNCLRYATCSPSYPGAEKPWPPGFIFSDCSCDKFRDGMRKLGAVPTDEAGQCPAGMYKIAGGTAVIPGGCTFHVIREDPDGSWRSRDGCDPIITVPTPTKDNWPTQFPSYPTYCGEMCWPFDAHIPRND